jgi:hypothetical protein
MYAASAEANDKVYLIDLEELLRQAEAILASACSRNCIDQVYSHSKTFGEKCG